MKKGDLSFGDIVWTDFDPSVGHEYQDKRPAVVIQSDEQLHKSNLVTVVPITSSVTKATRDDIKVSVDSNNKLRRDSVIKMYCITSFDYKRLKKKIGTLDSNSITLIKQYLKKHFNL